MSVAQALALALLVAGAARAGDAHPWDGLCLAQSLEAGNTPAFALQTRTHTADEDPCFARTVTTRHRRRGPTARISFYR